MAKFTTKFIIDTNRQNALMIRVTCARKIAPLYLGVSYTPEELEEALAPNPTASAARLRALINSYQQHIDDVRLDIVREGVPLDAKQIRDRIRTAIFGEETETKKKGEFVQFMLKLMEGMQNKSTRNLYGQTLARMRVFDANLDSRSFADINLDYLERLEAFMATTACKNARNTHLRNIRAVFNRAIDHELTDLYPFRRFKIRPEETEKRSLTLEQLRLLFTTDQVQPYAELYRDMFKLIFMLIGINTADLHALKEIGPDGRIHYKRAKTGRLYSIKVEPEALEIIERWRGKNGLLCIADRWTDSRQFMHQCNKNLKLIGPMERVGRGGKKVITPLFPELTTYWARHTWATIAADLDIPDAVIACALGHATPFTTTEIYIKRNLKKVDEANRRVLDWVLYGKNSLE